MPRTLTRRDAIATAASLGATLAWPFRQPRPGNAAWQERRDIYPQGVASGDPTPDGMVLWTRRPPAATTATTLTLEISTEPQFHHIVSATHVTIGPDADWTARVLATGLTPGRLYWYRFSDEHGLGSRIGRTRTAPAADDARPAHFAFVSCQNHQMGTDNAYARMIWEDERRPVSDQLGFVLHLGDFVYEILWYPEDRPQGYAGRNLRELVRYPSGEKHADFHVPTTVADYRALYQAYLADPDLQNARARWPFICVPDNHEFSWKGWQTQEFFDGRTIPAQTRKVAAFQAWFEYQPSRVAKSYTPPAVSDAPLVQFDDHGLGQEPANLAALRSLTIYRTLRWGKRVDLILTDNRSFRAEPLTTRPDAAVFHPPQFPGVVSEDVTEMLDAGQTANGGAPPETITFAGKDLPNPRRTAPPQSMLGATQKAWFLERLGASTATWKLWGNSVAMLDWRLDFQNLPNLPNGLIWPTTGYALLGDDDWSGYRAERREIVEYLRGKGITGVAAVSGDRHAFLAGVVAPEIVEFVTGSISAPGLFESLSRSLAPDHPLRPVYVYQPAGGGPPQPAINLSLLRGVRAALELQRTGDLQQALTVSDAQVAGGLAFADVAGHGYGVVQADAASLTVEFVCIPAPLERGNRADGGPLAYRVRHRVDLWNAGAAPQVQRIFVEGTLPLIPSAG
jgi:alkaline phosphatase D